MGLFFKSTPIVPAIRTSLQAAFMTNPAEVEHPGQRAAEIAEEIQQQARGKFAWDRFLVAIVLLVVLGALGFYTAQSDKLEAWNKVLLHSFELIFGGVVGLITGEAAAQTK